MTTQLHTVLAKPHLLSILAVSGVAWNLFGAVQFVSTLTATTDSMMAQGLSAQQAAVMMGYPAWMTLAFGIGVLTGLIGSFLLATRDHRAQVVLAVSLISYCALWAGDLLHGVFAVMGAPQVIVLSLVVAIAAVLLAASWYTHRIA